MGIVGRRLGKSALALARPAVMEVFLAKAADIPLMVDAPRNPWGGVDFGVVPRGARVAVVLGNWTVVVRKGCNYEIVVTDVLGEGD